MTNKLKAAFDVICAEESLKSNTTLFLQKEIQKRSKSKERTVLKRYAVAFASVIIILLPGILTYKVYFTPTAYVGIDVNPSIELMLNRFDRIINAYSYNDDGKEIIEDISIKHKSYDAALAALMEAMTEQGYFQGGGLVSVTLQADNKSKETALLTSIQSDIENYMTGHHHTVQLDIFPVSGDTRSYSYELGISPAKYIAIQELIVADPSASIESCRSHSISEIKQLTQKNGNNHGNGNPNGGNEPSNDSSNSHNNENDAQNSGQANGKHGANSGKGHHGSDH